MRPRPPLKWGPGVLLLLWGRFVAACFVLSVSILFIMTQALCVLVLPMYHHTGSPLDELVRTGGLNSISVCFCVSVWCDLCDCVNVFDAYVRYGCLPAGRAISPLYSHCSASVITPTVGHKDKNNTCTVYYVSSDSAVSRSALVSGQTNTHVGIKSLSGDVMYHLAAILEANFWAKVGVNSWFLFYKMQLVFS